MHLSNQTKICSPKMCKNMSIATLFIIEKIINKSSWNTIFKDKSEKEDDIEQTKKKMPREFENEQFQQLCK